MKNPFLFLILIVLLSGCVSKRYVLTDAGKDKRFLMTAIRKASKTGQTTKKPMLVVDGVPYRYDVELEDQPLQLASMDIKQIDVIKEDIAKRVYGDPANKGVLLITTKAGSKPKAKPVDQDNVLFLLEGREISKSELGTIDPNDIESIDVVKDKAMLKQYTSKAYDGVVIIHLKKKE